MYKPDYRDRNFGYWRSRGYLPHLEDPVAVQHVTFHLADSLPVQALARLDEELTDMPPDHRAAEKRRKLDLWLDAGHGACALRDPTIAEMMQETLLFFDGQRYQLFAWVVMPNHVHVLFQAMSGHEVSHIVKSWKSFSGKAIGSTLRKGGAETSRIWHRDHWDRYMRSHSHFDRVVEYIHENPVKAGLVRKSGEWSWSSANARFANLGLSNQLGSGDKLPHEEEAR